MPDPAFSSSNYIASSSSGADMNENKIINLKDEEWQEISSLMPMLTYGEESNTLLSILLDLPAEYYGAPFDEKNEATTNDVKRRKIYCSKCQQDGKIASSSPPQMYSNDPAILQREEIEKLLFNAVERILQVKNTSCAQITRGEKRSKQSPKGVDPKKNLDINGNDQSSIFVLPWNVLLRVIVRLSSHAAKISQSSTKNNNNCCSCSNSIQPEEQNTNETLDSDTEGEKVLAMHPILQALDIILSEIQVSMRISKRASYSSPGKEEHDDKKKMEKAATAKKSHFIIPQDRLLYDWKRNRDSNYNTEASNFCWGPSRYEFIKDAETITAMLRMSKCTLGNISVTEWQERVNSIIDMLDEQCGNGLTNGNCDQVQHRHCSPLQSKSTTASFDSPASSPLARVTRDHVKRLLNSAGVKKSLSQAKEDLSTSFQSSSSKEKKKSPTFPQKSLQREVKTEIMSNDPLVTEELEDAYRVAIVFSSPDTNAEVRETIERRLSILVQTLRNSNQNNVALSGAQAYLKTLLNTLVQPSDISVWKKLMDDSGGKETPMMLRRGRAVLVSYLAMLKSPGWKEIINQLSVSPIPAQLGFLSHDDEASSSAAKCRSLFLLPPLSEDTVALPPAPFVTEVGLSVCIRNALEGNDLSMSRSPINTSGVSLFRSFAPYPESNCNDDMLNSHSLSLPNMMELTRDLFDLILRLAADDDTHHKNKSFPLRLVTPLPSECLDIVLQVASDFSDWLCPHSVSDRYRFILEQVCRSFQSIDLGNVMKGKADATKYAEDPSESWYTRASTFLQLVKLPHLRARIALYLTQFFILLCGRGEKHKLKTSRNSSKQPHFYALLQQKQFSKFWDNIDNVAIGISSRRIISRVFDLSLCQKYILPLALQCSIFLTEKNHCSTHRDRVGQDVLSLVTILGSVLNVLSDLLHDCTHLGSAVEMLSFSFSYNLFGVDNAQECDGLVDLFPPTIRNTCMWEQASAQLQKVYDKVWGKSSKKLNNNGHWETLDTAKGYVTYKSIDANSIVLIPSFDNLVRVLIKYASSVPSIRDNVAEAWCKFAANTVFDRYIDAFDSIQVSVRNKREVLEKTIRSLWIRYLASTLQKMITEQSANKMEDRSTEVLLEDLITPLLQRLHIKVMKRALRYRTFHDESEKKQPDHRLPPDLVAMIFTDLYKQESQHFLSQSHRNTKSWDTHRKCIETVFVMTPPSTFFAHTSYPGLSGYSSDALAELWRIFGQSSLIQSTLIMVAAGLHVNASATHLIPNQNCTSKDKELLKQRYVKFSSCVKQCIVSSFDVLNVKAEKCPQDIAKLTTLVRSVRRDLSSHGEADVGLTWWNEITNELFASVEESASHGERSTTRKKARSHKSEIAEVFSTLEHDLSAIVHQSKLHS